MVRGPIAPPVDWSRARRQSAQVCGCGGACSRCASAPRGRSLAVGLGFDRLTIRDSPAVVAATALATLQPYERAVQAAVARAASSRGLDIDALTVDDVIDDAHLAEALLGAARRAIRVPTVVSTTRVTPPAMAVAPSRAGGVGRRAGGLHLAKNPDTGEVKYPTGYRSGPAGSSDGPACGIAELEVLSAVRARVLDTIHRVPRRHEGVPYRDLVKEYLDKWEDSSCFDQAYCEDEREMKTCYGGFNYFGDDLELSFGPAFFEPSALWLVDPLDFQAGIVVHELVHMIDRHETVPVGTCGQCGASCRNQEHRAAYVQARFMDVSECGAELFACAYGRSMGGTSASQNALATIGEFLACYAGAAGLVTVLTLAALCIAAPAAAVVALALGGLALASLLLVFLFDAWT